MREFYETVAQQDDFVLQNHRYLRSWFRILKRQEVVAELQVKYDFPNDNTVVEKIYILSGKSTVITRKNPEKPTDFAELLQIAMRHL